MRKKKNDKKVKFLYEKVHNGFLTKYESTNIFSQIFKAGVYNCVSATGLYSLTFDYFQIPYSIQERPTHVYLVAHPENERVQIETTTPIGGYYVFDQTFKQNYIKKLADYKLISAVEHQTKSVDVLFDTHFFNNQSIDLTKLIGIQYFNSGLYFIDKGENEKAFHQFEKAYFFYPSERIRYLMFNIGIETFNQLSYSDEKKAAYLSKISRFKKEGINDEMIMGEFYRITQVIFLQDGDRVKYEKIYNSLINSIADEAVKNQITYIYNYENGRILYNQGRYAEATPLFERALAAKPNSVEIAGLFISNLNQLKHGSTDTKKYVSELQEFSKKYPSLSENNNFITLLAQSTLEVALASFEKSDSKEGEKYKTLFEELVGKKSSVTSLLQYEIGRAYSSACVYYFKIGQKSKAKLLVEKGLTMAPNNYELRMRQEMLAR